MTKWPKKVKHRNKVLAKIYRPCAGRDSYRVAWSAAGKRQMKSFPNYSGKGGAKEYGEELVKELAKHSQAVMLTPGQATDALAAIERLNAFREKTGRKLSLLATVSEYCEAATKLPGHTLTEAADGFLRTCATVKRTDLSEAVEELIATREVKTKELDNNGRPKLHLRWHLTTARWLREFAATLPGYAVEDLTREHLKLWAGGLANLGSKSRNDHREIVRQFLRWSVRQDYLPQTQRLLEADGMKAEDVDAADNDFYRSKELRRLLDAAGDDLRPVIALQGLAGLRRDEVMRLTWEEVFAAAGHITVTTSKSKTRQRRLVAIVPALAAWLRPYRQKQGGVFPEGADVFNHRLTALREATSIASRKNGLRHGFCTHHFALHRNENQTAAEAGNSPTMIHRHYRGLATKKEAKAWFALRPAKTAASGKIITLAQKGAAA